jgi:hypothetical protein
MDAKMIVLRQQQSDPAPAPSLWHAGVIATFWRPVIQITKPHRILLQQTGCDGLSLAKPAGENDMKFEIDELAIERLDAVNGGDGPMNGTGGGGAPGTGPGTGGGDGKGWQRNPFVQGFLNGGGTFTH